LSTSISTTDSQILSCSAALTQDQFLEMARSYRLAKVEMLLVLRSWWQLVSTWGAIAMMITGIVVATIY